MLTSMEFLAKNMWKTLEEMETWELVIKLKYLYVSETCLVLQNRTLIILYLLIIVVNVVIELSPLANN